MSEEYTHHRRARTNRNVPDSSTDFGMNHTDYSLNNPDFVPEPDLDTPFEEGEFWQEAELEDTPVWPESASPQPVYDAMEAPLFDSGESLESTNDLNEPDSRPMDDAVAEPHSIFKPRTKKPNFIVSVLVNVVRIFAVLILLGSLAAVGAVAGIAKGYVETAPTLNLTALDEQAQTSFIYDASGNLITEYKGTENRVMVSIGAMPQYLRDAFVAVEDARFYTHNGIDIKRIVGAFVSNLVSSSVQGGSTITQQLIKNTLLSSEQSYKRKIQEAYLALQLEQTYTKDQILESYLNTIYLGENYYGVQTAAQGFFGKGLGELTLRECAMLAGVTRSPAYYNPRRNFYTRQKEGVDYPKITNDRTDYVLRCMYENQFITYEQYQAALNPATASVLTADPSGGESMYSYPHYVEYAISETVRILLRLNNLENTSANRSLMETRLRTGGYRVMLAIDTQMQETLESTIENWSQYPSLRDPSDKVYKAKNSDGTYTEIIQPQCAAVILDYRTGEIKAIVGGRTHPTARKTLNRAIDMKMPVGSAIKPIGVYAPALELGASPASVVFNMPLPIAGWKNSKLEDTWPRNYGGAGYTGPTTLRTAVKKSLNTAAAQTEMTMVGVARSVDYLRQLGIDDDHIDATPFGVTLGSSGVTPMQMTVAYGVLANAGVYQEPISVLGISDSNGNVVWDGHQQQDRRRVFSASTAYMMVDMMKDVVSGGTATGAKIKGQTVAGKTGTNSDQKGVSFVGMTGYYVSSIWVGHDNYKALASKSTGSSACVPIWQSYMSKIHTAKGLGNRDILEGDAGQYNLVKVTTCAVSGQLATDACRSDSLGYGVVTDYWAIGTQPEVYCQMHQPVNVCAESGMAATEYCPEIVTRSAVVIPNGHPLGQFIGTEYEGTLREYLGSFSTRFAVPCTIHTGYAQPQPQQPDSGAVSAFVNDARSLITQAQALQVALDPTGAHYQAIQNAITNLQAVLDSGGAAAAEIIARMSALTQAMAGIY